MIRALDCLPDQMVVCLIAWPSAVSLHTVPRLLVSKPVKILRLNVNSLNMHKTQCHAAMIYHAGLEHCSHDSSHDCCKTTNWSLCEIHKRLFWKIQDFSPLACVTPSVACCWEDLMVWHSPLGFVRLLLACSWGGLIVWWWSWLLWLPWCLL